MKNDKLSDIVSTQNQMEDGDMNNTEIINGIIMEMSNTLDNEQLMKLKSVLQIKLANTQIVPITTEVAVLDEDVNDVLLNKWIIELKVNNYSEGSIYNYVNACRKMFDFNHKAYNQVTKDDLLCYIAHLKNRKLSDNTIDNWRKYIKQFFKWLVMNDYIIQSPFDKLQKCTKRRAVEKVVLDEYEIEMVRDTYHDIRDKAIFDVLEATGVRVSEFCNIKLRDVNFAKGYINIYASKTNTYRRVYLTPRALKHLTEYRAWLDQKGIESEYLFIGTKRTGNGYCKMDKAAVNERIHKMMFDAQIDKHVTVHTFRKTLATKLVRKGAKPISVQRILGHSKYDTTITYYSIVSDEDVEIDYRKAVV